jgi:hypothetical protein
MLWKCKIKYIGSEEWVEEIRVSDGPLHLDTKNIQSSITTRLTYKIKTSLIPPTILKSIQDGKTYVVPMWLEVHPETTQNDLIWERFKPKPKEQPVEKKTFQFESSSDKGIFYVVKVNGTKVICNCPGVWRSKDRECKHMKQVKQELGLQKT